MKRLTYVLRFERPPDSPSEAATAPALVVTTQIEATGVSSRWKPLPEGKATLDLQYAVLGDGSWFAEWGTVTFGDAAASSLTFGSVAPGTLGPADADGFSHGTVTYAIGSGSGQFSGATGFINSNFLVDLKFNHLIDTHLGVVRVP